jgi:cysteine sulfinate desulfinase/cysteine desulfurase-like protein
MNVPESLANGSIRFSLGRYNTVAEVERTLQVLSRALEKLRERGQTPEEIQTQSP